MGNIGQPVGNRIIGAFNHLQNLLAYIGLTSESVAKIDIWNIPVQIKVIKKRCKGKYPTQTFIQTEFAHSGEETGLQSSLVQSLLNRRHLS